jgi:hypothetical protein
MKIPINIVVFDTSHGHWSRTDIHEACIQNLNSKIPLSNFARLYCHIKVRPGEDEHAAHMKEWYQSRGFKVVLTKGDFQHFQVSHQRGYCQDIITAFGDPYVNAPYTLWLESDWKWDDKGNGLLRYFYEAISLLEYDKDILSVRFPRFLNEVARLNNLKKRHNMDVQCVKHSDFDRIFVHNDNFSANPNLCRTRDLYLASLVLKRNFEQFGNHIEMGWTHCLRWMSDAKYPYAIFDPKEVSVLHAGCKSVEEEDKPGQVYEKID